MMRFVSVPVSSSVEPADDPERSVAEFFAEIEDRGGPALTAEDHEALVAAIRSDREGAGT
jgi:hypothetical protein